jgi:tRNA/rRNA methyltransferase/tRNA (cytidine32/uridine32-2'-O)-methyltransferase
MFLQDIRIVLDRVSESGNAGAVCRVMKNMGLSNLRLAAPLPMDNETVIARAVHASDIWENAQIFDSLEDAVADCSIVVGTTRRRGSNRKNISMPPRALAVYLSERPGPAAIVFGNERTGLEEQELDICNIASHIPAGEIQPSLNLSHAVQVYAYEFFLAMETQNNVKGEWQAINQTEIKPLVESITQALSDLGFYYKPGREKQTRFLRDVISRAGLTERESLYFRDIIVKAARM